AIKKNSTRLPCVSVWGQHLCPCTASRGSPSSCIVPTVAFSQLLNFRRKPPRSSDEAHPTGGKQLAASNELSRNASRRNVALGLPDVLESEFAQLHGDFSGEDKALGDEARLKAIWSAIHALPEKRAALCISGGGIRSATFGLGVLQGLARCG